MKTTIVIVCTAVILGSCNVRHSPRNVDKPADTRAYSDTIKSFEDYSEPVPADTSYLVDYDGNSYKTVRIGKQVWMAENLKVTRYRDGTPVAHVTDVTEWSNLSTGAYSWYSNDSASYAVPYGALYNWYAVNTGMLCPPGWHVPKDSEWTVLANYLKGTEIAGGKLKSTDTIYWYSPNTGATNETGFTALPGGGRCSDGIFGNLGLNSLFWTSTGFDEKFSISRSISHYYREIYGYGSHKKNGFSVRCVKDR